ncbi:MAG: MlaD family protein, partial [Gammaproteobacteria bacterium]|nr:MlaD family protein [Gammaproteobacteria bacterium]
MEAEARYTFVGAAVLVLVAALVGGLVWLKDIGGRGEFTRYAIHFEKQALDGLQLGAEVNLRGIKVGRVEDYALSHDKLNRVRVVVRVDGRAPVRTNTVAVVTRNFVTGIAAITLVTPEPAGDELTAVPDGERYPVIGEGR